MAPETFWQQQIRRHQKTFNLAWLFASATTPLLTTAIILATAILALRHLPHSFSPLTLALSTLALLFLTGSLTWKLAKNHFEQPLQTLTRLDASLSLHNALFTAHSGIAPWPAPRTIPPLHWNWSRLLTPSLLTLLLLTTAALIPLPPQTKNTPPPSQQPLAWKEIQTILDTAKKQPELNQEQIEKFQKQLNNLQNQPPETWFQQQNLEASDALTKSLNSQLQSLSESSQQTQNTLPAANSPDGAQATQKSLQQIAQNPLSPSQEMMRELQQTLSQTNHKQGLSQQQIQQLSQQLQQLSNAAQNAKNHKKQAKSPGGKPKGHDENAPDTDLSHHPPNTTLPINGTKLTTLPPSEQPAPLNNVLTLQHDNHKINNSTDTSQSGALSSPGQGGQLIWKESLDPNEQQAIRQFFQEPK